MSLSTCLSYDDMGGVCIAGSLWIFSLPAGWL